MKTDLILKRDQIPQRGRPNHEEMDANLDRMMYWSGDWAAGTYQTQEVVEHKGRAWVCNSITTIEEPGLLATEWTMIGDTTLEVWQATPILSMSATVIQWTFVPLFPGQTAEIMSEAAGVFTFLTVGAALEFKMTSHVSFEFAANNSEADYSITPALVGSGIETLINIIDSDNSPRAGSFGRTAYSAGTVLAAAGDTLSFTGTSAGTNGSDVDLLDMFLQISGPTP